MFSLPSQVSLGLFFISYRVVSVPESCLGYKVAYWRCNVSKRYDNALERYQARQERHQQAIGRAAEQSYQARQERDWMEAMARWRAEEARKRRVARLWDEMLND